MTLRPDVTYRAARRNLAKAHQLDWSALERGSNDGLGPRGTVRVMLPRWAWEMPPDKPKMPRWVRRGAAKYRHAHREMSS